MTVHPGSAMADALALVAPGRPLREGIERVLLAKRGALIVIGDDAGVLSLCTGGFLLDAEYSPQRFSELAKMDGAIVLSARGDRIARANVHLMPSPAIPTTETGTRHRTAERVARSVDFPVVSVSGAMGLVTIYRGDQRHALQPASRLHEHLSQALQTLQQFRARFDLAVTALSALEIEDTVTVRDVVSVLQPCELIRRVGAEIGSGLIELGDEGRLLELQLRELTEGVSPVGELVVRDYLQAKPPDAGEARLAGATNARSAISADSVADRHLSDDHAHAHGHRRHVGDAKSTPVEDALMDLARLSTDDLLDAKQVAGALGVVDVDDESDGAIEPRGYRLLHRLPRFPDVIADRIVDQFAGLQGIMRASVADLEMVEGVGEVRARSVKKGLARLAELSILDRFT